MSAQTGSADLNNLQAEHHLVSLKIDAGKATAQGRDGTCLHQSKDG